MTCFILISGDKDPGAMGDEALICFDGKPVAKLTDVKELQGMLYGKPEWRSFVYEISFKAICEWNEVVDLEIFSHEHGDRSGLFRIRSHENDELSFRQVGDYKHVTSI